MCFVTRSFHHALKWIFYFPCVPGQLVHRRQRTSKIESDVTQLSVMKQQDAFLLPQLSTDADDKSPWPLFSVIKDNRNECPKTNTPIPRIMIATVIRFFTFQKYVSLPKVKKHIIQTEPHKSIPCGRSTQRLLSINRQHFLLCWSSYFYSSTWNENTANWWIPAKGQKHKTTPWRPVYVKQAVPKSHDHWKNQLKEIKKWFRQEKLSSSFGYLSKSVLSAKVA